MEDLPGQTLVLAFAARMLSQFRDCRLAAASCYPSGGGHFLMLKLLPEVAPSPEVSPSCWIEAYGDWLLISPDDSIARAGDSDAMDVPAFAPLIGAAVTKTTLRAHDLSVIVRFSTGHLLIVLTGLSRGSVDGSHTDWEITAATGLEVLHDEAGIRASWAGSDEPLDAPDLARFSASIADAFWVITDPKSRL